MAIVVALGGIALSIVRSGVFKAVSGGTVPTESLLQDAVWGIGGIVIAGVVLVIGHGYRCINCDAQQ